MPRRIVADPEGGRPGKSEEKGTWVAGTYRMVAYVYGPNEVVPPDLSKATIAELRAKYWNPERRALVIPLGAAGTYELGPKLLNQTSDSTLVHLRPEFSYPTTDPKPEVCSCGKLPFVHAVVFHENASQ